MNAYEQLVERIAKTVSISKEDVERKVEAKRAKLSGLISKEGAAQIIAAEMGVILDNQRLKVVELAHGMKKATTVGKVIQVYPARSFNKNGKEGSVASFILADESGSIRVVMWDTHHIELFESGTLKQGDTVEITNGAMRNGDLHLSAFSDIKASEEKIDNVKSEMRAAEAKLQDVKQGQQIKSRAIIVQVFEPRYFTAKDSNEKRALLNIVLDDGTSTIRAVLFSEAIKKLGLSDEDIFSLEKFEAKKNAILGEEMVFTGTIKNNQFFNKLEFSVNDAQPLNVDELIKSLEVKA